MKKLLFMALAALWLVGCSEAEQTEQSDELTKVSLSFSPYEQSAMARTTRAASSIAGIVTHLDVWIYESGSEVADIHQTSADADFGSLSVTLNKTKTYTIYAIGHKADGATLSDGVISFTNDKAPASPALQVDYFTAEPLGKPL